MKPDPLTPLRDLTDEILRNGLTPQLKSQIARMHAGSIDRALLSAIAQEIGGTPLVILAIEAEWDRLEAERLRGT